MFLRRKHLTASLLSEGMPRAWPKPAKAHLDPSATLGLEPQSLSGPWRFFPGRSKRGGLGVLCGVVPQCWGSLDWLSHVDPLKKRVLQGHVTGTSCWAPRECIIKYDKYVSQGKQNHGGLQRFPKIM